MYHVLKGKGFFIPWLAFHLWAGKRGFFFVKGLFGEEKLDFRVLHSEVHLGEGENIHIED